jgi:hypothetical protein
MGYLTITIAIAIAISLPSSRTGQVRFFNANDDHDRGSICNLSVAAALARVVYLCSRHLRRHDNIQLIYFGRPACCRDSIAPAAQPAILGAVMRDVILTVARH